LQKRKKKRGRERRHPRDVKRDVEGESKRRGETQYPSPLMFRNEDLYVSEREETADEQ